MTAKRTGRFWVATVASVVGIAVTAALGFWQWGRAAEKNALQASIEQRKGMAPLDATALAGGVPLASIVHRPVALRGRWLPRYTVYLDNRQMQGRPGFYVVTPLQVEGIGVPVLVERGWVQRNFIAREKLPPVTTPEGVVEVRGRVAPPPSKLYEFAGAQQGPIRQNLDLAQFRVETGLALPGLAVQQEGVASEGLLRDWPQPGSGAERNYGYAFQWWGMASVIAFLYGWFQFIVPRRRSRSQAQPHA